MEGLEVTEIPNSSLERTFRIDSEFYSKSNLKQVEILKRINAISLQHFAYISDGNHMTIKNKFTDKGIPYYRGGDIYNSFIEFTPNPLRIPQCVFDSPNMIRSHLRKGDILMSIVGAIIGNISIVSTDDEATCSCKLAILRPKPGVSTEFLAAYLRSSYGQQQIQKFRRGTGQTGLILEDFDQLLVPELNGNIVESITEIVNRSKDCFLRSQQLYTSAENYLLECLGLRDFASNPDAFNIKSLKESFLETGRLDSEYYLPKYEDCNRHLASYANGYGLVRELCTIKDANYTPDNSTKYQYIELSNIGQYGDISGVVEQLGKDLPSRARRIVEKGDLILSSIEGSLGSCALIDKYYDKSLCSTGFYVLQSNYFNPETLLTLFKSYPIQQLMKKGCSGTILSGISKTELENIKLPMIRLEIQDEIAKYVRNSFKYREEALRLLEDVKDTIEMSISAGGGKLLNINKLLDKARREWYSACWVLMNELDLISDLNVKTVFTLKTLSKSLISRGRLDAEYYQPKFDSLVEQLKGFKTKKICEIATISKSIEPGSDAYKQSGIPFVRISDISKFGLSEPEIFLDRCEYDTVPRPKKNTILLTKDGSVGIAYKADESLDVITSGAIVHLNIKVHDVLPDYFTLILNSIVVKMQAERDAGGSIIKHWKTSEIEQVLIPILPMYLQRKISIIVQESFKLRKESQKLLLEAEKLVEEFINEVV